MSALGPKVSDVTALEGDGDHVTIRIDDREFVVTEDALRACLTPDTDPESRRPLTLSPANQLLANRHGLVTSPGGVGVVRLEMLDAMLTEARAAGAKPVPTVDLQLAGHNAPLPDGYQWGPDALEQFEVGKRCATVAILKALGVLPS